VRGNGWGPHAPGAAERADSRFPVGTTVRLRGKPDQLRKVIQIEWHSIRREYSYVIETSARGRFRPYWFAAQLLLAV
jgi:hypothetical protein